MSLLYFLELSINFLTTYFYLKPLKFNFYSWDSTKAVLFNKYIIDFQVTIWNELFYLIILLYLIIQQYPS